jgi:hypothetical protein
MDIIHDNSMTDFNTMNLKQHTLNKKISSPLYYKKLLVSPHVPVTP